MILIEGDIYYRLRNSDLLFKVEREYDYRLLQLVNSKIRSDVFPLKEFSRKFRSYTDEYFGLFDTPCSETEAKKNLKQMLEYRTF